MFTFPNQIVFRNHVTGKFGSLLRADKIADLSCRAETIASICNETLIYEALFRQTLGGEPYTIEKALEFVSWAKSGWSSNSHFVFFMTNEKKNIVGCMDIKSANLDCAEIGYWSSKKSRGNTSNALNALVESATVIGFRSLIAYVNHKNVRSIRVLERVGFKDDFSVKQRKGHRTFSFTSKNKDTH